MFMVEVELCYLGPVERQRNKPFLWALFYFSKVLPLVNFNINWEEILYIHYSLESRYSQEVIGNIFFLGVVYFVQVCCGKGIELLSPVLSIDTISAWIICFHNPQSRIEGLKEEQHLLFHFLPDQVAWLQRKFRRLVSPEWESYQLSPTAVCQEVSHWAQQGRLSWHISDPYHEEGMADPEGRVRKLALDSLICAKTETMFGMFVYVGSSMFIG